MPPVCDLRNAWLDPLLRRDRRGFLAAVTLAAGPPRPVVRAVTQQDIDTALVSTPGIAFTQPQSHTPSSALDKRFKNRFQPTDSWTPVSAYRGPSSGHMSVTNALGRHQRKHGGTGYENITSANALGTQYGVDVRFNQQKLTLALDTGSSDTWAVSTSANCTGSSYYRCYFGPSFAGGFDGRPPLDEHLYIRYGDGEVVQGPIGYMTVTVAGLRVENQIVGLANDTLWNGNNVTSGILGLAYPAITNAYAGPFGAHDPWYQHEYAPVFANMVSQGLADNYFSIAINRDASDGVLAFGGVPDDLVGVDYSTVGMADIIIANLLDQDDTASAYSFYTIIPDGWRFGTSTDDRKLPFIVDTGTTLLYLPADLAEAINAAFEPAAEYDFMFGAWYTSCDAVPPRVGVVIDGQNYWLNPQDLMLHALKNPLNGLCMTSVASGASGPFILGDVFLKNVVAVFDVDDAVMQFASRRNY